MRALAAASRRAGTRAWAVGGAVRDALLSRKTLDLDATVGGCLDRIASALEREGLGRLVPLSDSNPKAVRIAGKRTLDIVEAEDGSLARDLARRDFTVNAIAAALPSGELIDPHGGAGDLRSGKLRMLSERNLEEDPLRTFRAARFIATHGLLPDRETARACRRQAAGVARAAPERVAVELQRILESARAAPALQWAAAHGLIVPALSPPHPPGRGFSRALEPLDAPAIRRREPDRRLVVRLASLAAALGLAPGETAGWLRRLRYGRDLIGEAVLLRELAAQAALAATEDERWRWVRDAGAAWDEALTLLLSREPARRSSAAALASRARRARRRPRIRGRDVLAWTGMMPGPRVGRLLSDVEVEILRGRLTTRAQARRWLLNAAKRET
jgi:tRNA nucleotidyltransferase/poly(A) polymerase